MKPEETVYPCELPGFAMEAAPLNENLHPRAAGNMRICVLAALR